jgi:twitching motility protein PilT
MIDLSKLIEGAQKFNASDIHLMEDCTPYFRVDGTIVPVKEAPVTHDGLLELLKSIMPERLASRLEEERGADFSYQYKDEVRCRMVAFYERRKLRIVIRLIPLAVPTLEELDLPEMLTKLGGFVRGMVLVTGPTGSGKSSTLAAIIDHVNSHRKVCIITIEDPIEFVHPNKRAIVAQREVGEDIENFSSGLVQAMRQDPDIVLVGEMRDMETMRTALRASATGHLVLSTLHTTTAVQTIERIISTFPQSEHEVLLEELANNMKAAISQTLMRRAEGKGRVAALEIMIVNDSIQKLINENRIADIFSVMKGGDEDMQVFDQGVARLVREKKIAFEEGARYARDFYAYRRYVKGVTSSSDQGGIIGGFTG